MQWIVPLFDPDLDEIEVEAVSAVIRSKWLTMGERTSEFEARFAAFCGVKHAIALNSATAALHIALMSAGIKPGDEVIVPSLTFVATANVIRYCGATPVFAEVESADEWNVSRRTLEAQLTPATRAVIVVHYAGYPCRMNEIAAFAREHGLVVVEDVAHAPGANLDGRAMGAWGDAGCFSFFSNKNMTTGEGGMLTTDRDDLAERGASLALARDDDADAGPAQGSRFLLRRRRSRLQLPDDRTQRRPRSLPDGPARRRQRCARPVGASRYREQLHGVAGIAVPVRYAGGRRRCSTSCRCCCRCPLRVPRSWKR